MGLSHSYVSTKPDPVDTSIIGKTKWNADHIINGGNLGALVYQGVAGAPSLINSVAVGQVLVSNGVGVVPGYSATPSVTSITVGGNTLDGTALIVGTNPATSGAVRLPNNAAVNFRNAANSADLSAVVIDGSNVAYFGGDMSVVQIGSSSPLVRFGGATSAFPALKRNAATLEVRLADDSAQAGLRASYVEAGSASGGAVATTGAIRFYSGGANIYTRNVAQTANYNVIGSSVLSNDDVFVGDTSNNSRITLAAPIVTFTGQTSAYPALKRSAAALEVKLADDSAYANLAAAAFTSPTATGTLVTNDAQSVANNAVISLGTNAVRGFLFIENDTDGAQAIFALNGSGNSAQEVSDPSGIYTITAGTAASINVYWSVGNSRYELENKRGASRTFRLIRLGV